MNTLAPYAKAIVGFVLAALTATGTALTDGSITPAEWVAVAIAAVATLTAVYAVPNTETVE